MSGNAAFESKLSQILQLPHVEYLRTRKELAKDLGVPCDLLDAERRKHDKQESESGGTPSHWAVDPWPSPVDARRLIDAIVSRIKAHIVMNEHSALTAALWVMLAWAHDAAVHSPILMVSSPEAECGKTTLLGLINLMVPRGMIFVEGSAPVIFRMIDKWHPTLIVDEADSIFRNNKDLRAIINSGWTRGAGVPRCHPETHEPEFFETFGPKAIGLKGLNVPDTTLSRSIVIAMQRKLLDDKVTDFGHQDDECLAQLRRQLARFANDNIEQLRQSSPILPQGFGNRLAANWRLMLAIAELCGTEVAGRARTAAAALSRRVDRVSHAVELLHDIGDFFKRRKADRIHSDEIVAEVVAMEGRPWAEWGLKILEADHQESGRGTPQTVWRGPGANGDRRHQQERLRYRNPHPRSHPLSTLYPSTAIGN